jgi:4-hydroxy-tetrahydrodipicolinate reductase
MDRFTNYNVEMTETHHIHKLDAPSGTAITLAEGILDNLSRKTQWSKEVESKPSDLAIKSLREGEVPGIHTIRYESEVDSITITHDAKSREGFALGAVVAAEFTAGKKGFLGMSDLFDFLK